MLPVFGFAANYGNVENGRAQPGVPVDKTTRKERNAAVGPCTMYSTCRLTRLGILSAQNGIAVFLASVETIL